MASRRRTRGVPPPTPQVPKNRRAASGSNADGPGSGLVPRERVELSIAGITNPGAVSKWQPGHSRGDGGPHGPSPAFACGSSPTRTLWNPGGSQCQASGISSRTGVRRARRRLSGRPRLRLRPALNRGFSFSALASASISDFGTPATRAMNSSKPTPEWRSLFSSSASYQPSSLQPPPRQRNWCS